jgi:hypothetical protein
MVECDEHLNMIAGNRLYAIKTIIFNPYNNEIYSTIIINDANWGADGNVCTLYTLTLAK